jgi:hypothetical protein
MFEVLRRDKQVDEVLSVLSLQGDDFAADIRINVEGFPEIGMGPGTVPTSSRTHTGLQN